MKKHLLVILIILSCLPLLSLLTPGLPVTHDGQDHVARIANFYTSLSEGNSIPRWAGNLNWGFGHPILMFLYPLPSYAASLFHFIGLSFIDSTKLVFAVSFIASMVIMFLWLRDEWGEEPGFVGALLYGYAPYRFVDLYVRGAIGEHVAFVFIPILLWGMYGLSQPRSKIRWGIVLTIGTAGLLLSHNAISLMIVPFAVLYGLYLLCFVTEKKIQFLIAVFGFTFLGSLVSAFFWLPAFFEGKYTLRDIVTKGEVLTRMVPFSMFFASPWNYGRGDEITKQIGFVQWLFVASGVFFAFVSKEKTVKVFLSVSLLLFFSVLLFMTDISVGIWQRFSILQNFQFPWRLLTITVLLCSVIGAYSLSLLPRLWRRYIAGLAVVLLVLSTVQMWKPKAYKIYEESFFTGIYNSTTDTGESSPIWSVRFMEFRPEIPMEIATGSATIVPVNRTTTVRDYTVNAGNKVRLVENTLYFPGWQVYVDGQNIPVEFQDPTWRGRMTFWVDSGEHKIHIVFGNTKLRRVANGISLLSLIPLGIAIVLAMRRHGYKRTRFRKL